MSRWRKAEVDRRVFSACKTVLAKAWRGENASHHFGIESTSSGGSTGRRAGKGGSEEDGEVIRNQRKIY